MNIQNFFLNCMIAVAILSTSIVSCSEQKYEMRYVEFEEVDNVSDLSEGSDSDLSPMTVRDDGQKVILSGYVECCSRDYQKQLLAHRADAKKLSVTAREFKGGFCSLTQVSRSSNQAVAQQGRIVCDEVNDVCSHEDIELEEVDEESKDAK